MAKAVGEKRKAWNMIECIKNRVEQPPTSLIKAPVWPDQEGSQEGRVGLHSTEKYGGRTEPKA